jgi:hypothetical protein
VKTLVLDLEMSSTRTHLLSHLFVNPAVEFWGCAIEVAVKIFKGKQTQTLHKSLERHPKHHSATPQLGETANADAVDG